MVKNKFIVFIVLILALLTIGVASAQDSSSLNSTDIQGSVSASDEVKTVAMEADNSSEVSSLQSASDDNVLSANPDSFDDLETAINTAYSSGNQLVLKSDYLYNGSNIKYMGIEITSDNFVLDGNGSTIDVNNSGRIFHITANNVTLKNLVLINGKLDDQGGVIYNEKSGLTLVNVTFKDIQGRYGGAIYNTGNNLTIKDSTFYNINASDGGGAIWNKGDNLTIFNSSFDTIKAGAYGGVIYANGFNFNVINSNFTNAVAKSRSGGVIYNVGGNLTLINSTFTGNVANAGDASLERSDAVGGGVLWNDGDNLTILNSTFDNNRASNDGGAIFNNGNNLIVKDSIFTDNIAKSIISFDGYGGAIYNIGDNLIILNSTFTSNEGSIQGKMWRPGGAIYHIGANLTITNSTLNSNHAGIYHEGANLNITDSTFDGNSLAVNHTGDNISITNSSFINNRGVTEYLLYNVYGAIWSNGKNVNVTNSTFKNNHNFGIYNYGGNYFNLINSTFESTNAINSDYSGYGVYYYGSNLLILNSTFKSNNNGAYHEGENTTVNNSTFTSSGNAIYNKGNNLNVNNSTFKSNSYGIYNYGVNFNVTNCTFQSNSYGIYNSKYNGVANLTVKDSVFKSNSYGIYNYGVNFNVTNCTFQSNSYYGITNYGSNGGKGGVANLTVKDSNFTKSNGGIRSYGANVDIINIIVNSTSSYSGIHNEGNYLFVVNSTFNNNQGSGWSYYGGAIYNSGDYFNVTNSNFTNNRAYYGGAIYHYGKFFNLTNSTFNSNYANYRDGGAIHNEGNYFNVLNVTFDKNYAYDSGGAICNWGNYFNVTNVTFNNDYCNNWHGGALYNKGTDFNLINATFNNHNADDYGGALYNDGANCKVANVTFNNTYAGYGGALYSTGDNFMLSNATFNNSYTDWSNGIGGTIWHSGKNGIILNVTFTNSTTKYYGGTIYHSSGDGFYIINSTFTNSKTTGNNAYSYNSYGGGTIYNAGSSLTIINSTFTNSSAKGNYQNGGTIFNTGSGLTIINSTFTNSTAYKNGGTIYNTGSKFTIKNSKFTNTSTIYSEVSSSDYNTYVFGGGAIYNSNEYFTITNSTFSNMESAYCGGTIYNTGAYFTLKDSNVTDSSAKSDGGLIFNTGSTFKIINSTFINSTADANGGMICNYNGAYFNITNSTFTNAIANTTAYGKIYWDSYNGLSEEYDYYYMGGGFIWNNGNSFSIANSNFTNGTTKLSYDGSKYYVGGGAIYNMNLKTAMTNFTITNSTFINNSAKGESNYNYGGGAIYNYRGNVSISDSKFTGNDAVDGAVIYNTADSNLYSHNNDYSENTCINTHIYNAGNITSPVVITVLENKTILVDVYDTVSLNATIATDDGGSVAGQVLTFLANHEDDMDNISAVTNKNGTYSYDGYYINWVASTIVGAKYAGTSVDPIVRVGIYLTGEIPSKIAITISDKPFFAQDILVNVTVSAAGGAKLANNNPATNNGSVIFKVIDKDGNVIAQSDEILLSSDCKASHIFKYVNAGNYTVSAEYSGNTLEGKPFFKKSEANTSLEVCKVQGFELGLVSTTVPVGENTTIIVKVPEHATGNVTFRIADGGDKYFNVTIDPESSTATLYYEFSKATDYLVSAAYNGDINYVGSDKFEEYITVEKIGNYPFIIDAPDTQFESTAIVKIHLPSDITGAVILTIDNNETKNVAIVNGEGEVELNGLSMGIHNLTAYYNGTEVKYIANSTEAKLNITPKFDYDMNVTIDHNTTVNTASVKVGDDVTIKVIISKNVVGGTVYINLNNGTVLSKTVGKDGVVELTINNISYGDNIINKLSVYNLNINYTGYDLYGPKYNDTFKIYVDKWEPNMNVTIPDPVKRLEKNNITIHLPKDATITNESLYLVLNGPYGSGKYYAKSIVNGTANIELPDVLDEGYYSFRVHYGEDAKYWADDVYDLNFTVVESITVYDMNITSSPEDAKVGEDVVISLNLPSGARGNVTIEVGGVIYHPDIIDNVASIVLNNLTYGTHTIFATYSGDDTYKPGKYTTGSVTVSKVDDYELVISSPSIEIGQNATIKVTAPEGAEGRIILDFNNNELVANIVDSVATFTIPGLTNGTYVFNATYDGNDKYSQKTNSGKLVVTGVYDCSMDITINPSTPKLGDDVVINVNLPKDANGEVIITVDGDKYPVLVKNGVANVTIKNMTAGKHNITANYSGDNQYVANNTNTSFNVDKWDANLVVKIDEIKVGEAINITVTLAGINNTKLNGLVNVTINNKTYSINIINGTGSKIGDVFNKSGNYNFIANWAGDEYYKSTNDYGTFEVSKISNYNMSITTSPKDAKVGEDTVISLNLPDGAYGNVTIEIDGVIYHPEIIDNVASITLNNLTDGVHTIFATYSGDGTYSSSYTTGSINVSKIDDYELVISAPSIEIGQDAIIKVTAPADAEGRIILNFNNTELVANIVDSVATFTIPGLTNGTYVFNATYDGNDKYSQKTNSSKLVVTGPYDCSMNITINPTTPELGDDVVINVNLSKNATGEVIITVDGKNYPVDVVDGVANVTIKNMTAGKHNITASYSGDNHYASKNTNTSFDVDKGDAKLVVKIDDVKVGEPINITATLTGVNNTKLNGVVNVTINNKTYTINIINGTGSKIGDVFNKSGNVDYVVNWTGDDNYNPFSDKGDFNVSKVTDYDFNVTVPNAEVDKNITIPIELPDDATGNVTVTVGGKNYTVPVKNGTAVIVIPGLPEGDYNITVNYTGDDKYDPDSRNDTVKVSKVSDYNMTTKVDDSKVGGNVTISVSLPVDAEGEVSIIINGTSYNATVKNGSAVITIPDLGARNYTGTVVYSGDDKYTGTSKDVDFEVSKVTDYPMNVTVPDAKVGKNITIPVDLPDDATGNVTVTVDGKNYTYPVKNGTAVIVIPGLPEGDHNITINYTGDDKYDSTSVNKTVTVKNTINLTANDVVMIYKDGSRLYATLLDGSNNPIANATLSFTINGITYTRTTDANGSASIAINLDYGTYNAVVGYENNTVNATITVKSSIIAQDLVKMWMNGTQFYATFLGEGAKPLTNTNVTFNINGVFYTKTTDENGTAKLNINLRPGNYTLTAYNPFSGEQRGFNVLVKPLIYTSDLTKYYINGSRFEAKVYNYDGTFAANKTVTFNIHGVFYTKTADENGTVSLAINLRPGDYIITSIYEGLDIGNKVKVLPTLETSDLVMKYGDGSKFQVKTLDGQGNPLANQNITYNIHGVFYNKTTDSNGVANLNINLMKGKYIITSYWNDYEIGNKISIS